MQHNTTAYAHSGTRHVRTCGRDGGARKRPPVIPRAMRVLPRRSLYPLCHVPPPPLTPSRNSAVWRACLARPLRRATRTYAHREGTTARAAGEFSNMSGGVAVSTRGGGGIRGYYASKLEELELTLREKEQNLRRLEAQRNVLNTRGTRRVQACGSALAQ